jgi:hypothetical protein
MTTNQIILFQELDTTLVKQIPSKEELNDLQGKILLKINEFKNENAVGIIQNQKDLDEAVSIKTKIASYKRSLDDKRKLFKSEMTKDLDAFDKSIIKMYADLQEFQDKLQEKINEATKALFLIRVSAIDDYAKSLYQEMGIGENYRKAILGDFHNSKTGFDGKALSQKLKEEIKSRVLICKNTQLVHELKMAKAKNMALNENVELKFETLNYDLPDSEFEKSVSKLIQDTIKSNEPKISQSVIEKHTETHFKQKIEPEIFLFECRVVIAATSEQQAKYLLSKIALEKNILEIIKK